MKEVKIKSYTKEDGKWKADSGYTKQSFKYDKKKNPLKITTAEYKKSGKSKPSSKDSDKFKYKYKKGKTVKRIQYDVDGSTDIITKFKQGVPISQTWAVEGDNKLTFKYKSRYLTRLYYFYLKLGEKTPVLC